MTHDERRRRITESLRARYHGRILGLLRNRNGRKRMSELLGILGSVAAGQRSAHACLECRAVIAEPGWCGHHRAKKSRLQLREHATSNIREPEWNRCREPLWHVLERCSADFPWTGIPPYLRPPPWRGEPCVRRTGKGSP